MIIHCPGCEQEYDTTGYPEDYEFPCSECDAIIVARAGHSGSEAQVEEVEEAEEETARIEEPLEAAPEAGAAEVAVEEAEEAAQEIDNSTRKLKPPVREEQGPEAASPAPGEPAEASEAVQELAAPGEEEQEAEQDLAPESEASQDSLELPQFDPHSSAPEPTMKVRSPLLADTMMVPQASNPEEFVREALGEEAAERLREVQAQAEIEATMAARVDAGYSSVSVEASYNADASYGADDGFSDDPIGKDSPESTAVTANPLLMADQYVQELDPAYVQQAQEDLFGQEDSTSVTANPMLVADPNWNAAAAGMSQGYPQQGMLPSVPMPPPQGYAPQPAAMAAHSPIPGGYAPAAPPSGPLQPQMGASDTESTYGFDDAPDTSTSDLIVPQTDGRAIAGFMLLFAIVLGPLSLLLGALSYKRITRPESVLRGKGLALLAMIGGGLQTLIGAVLLLLLVMFPKGHPALSFVSNALKSFRSDPGYPDLSKRPADPAQLSMAQATALLQKALKLQNPQHRPQLQHVYVYQEPGARHAYVHWRDAQFGQNQRSVFYYSNRNHWHVAALSFGKSYEVRCSQAGPERLDEATARALIKSFWQVRGRFTGTRITHLYTTQAQGRRFAYAYWKLIKQSNNGPIQQWQIRSIFHRSSAGKWYISRYAVRIPKDELFSNKAKAAATLKAETARQIVAEYHKDQQKPFSPTLMYVVQGKGEAYFHWQQGRKRHRSLLRYSNAGAWHLARLHVPPAHALRYKLKQSQLSLEGVKKLLMRYIRNNARRLLAGRFERGGTKGKPPQRIPKIKKLYIFQPTGQNKAYVRWKADFPKKYLFVESLFQRSVEGAWHLSLLSTPRKPFDVRFFRKGGPRLEAAQAKEMLLQFWREDESSVRFTGARIEALYIYQKPSSRTAWAHWRMKKDGQATSMRSQFARSVGGVWYLATYDKGLGYRVEHHKKGPVRLSVELAQALLQSYLKSTKGLKLAKLHMPYVFQPRNRDVGSAFVRWILANKGTKREMQSLFHRSNSGRWYLSIASAPQTAPSLP